MKKCLVLLIASIMAGVFLMTGCAPELGYIIRDDIQFEDIGYFVEEGKPRQDVVEEELLSVMGYPYYIGESIDGIEYWYYYEDKVSGKATIKFIISVNGLFKAIDIDAEKEKPSTKEIVEKEITDPDQYKIPMRKNIREDELSFIDESTDVVAIQKKLGGPHDLMPLNEVDTKTLAYIYPLTNGNRFLIAYENGGVIVKAWVVDKEGDTQKVYVDRTDIYGTTNTE